MCCLSLFERGISNTPNGPTPNPRESFDLQLKEGDEQYPYNGNVESHLLSSIDDQLVVQAILRLAEVYEEMTGVVPNNVVVNRYGGAWESIGKHKDSNAKTKVGKVLSLTLGPVARIFAYWTPDGDGRIKKNKIMLRHSSLIWFDDCPHAVEKAVKSGTTKAKFDACECNGDAKKCVVRGMECTNCEAVGRPLCKCCCSRINITVRRHELVQRVAKRSRSTSSSSVVLTEERSNKKQK